MGEGRLDSLAAGLAGGGGGGGGGKGDRGRATPSLVDRIVIGGILSGLALIAAYGAGPYILPGFFDASSETERGLAELATCRLQVAALTTALKSRSKEEGRLRPQREALQSEGEGRSGRGAPQEEGEQGREGAGKGTGFGRRPEDMDEPSRIAEIKELRSVVQSLLQEKLQLQAEVKGKEQGDGEGAATSQAAALVTREAVEGAKKLLEGCNTVKQVSGSADTDLKSWKGYECNATREDLDRYMDYKPGELCPNDWYFVQRLIFRKNCFALPRRRCLSVTPAKPTEPLPLPDALFDQNALRDENVRWDLHQCKSFECLNTRSEGDCRNCFNLRMEANRWKGFYRGAPPMAEVLNMKKGSIRLGLDVGGGTGSFAAHMATHGVTVLTTAFNVETVPGKKAGLPYMETISQRGLVPLHWPHKARLPLYDGVLDIIHSVNSIKYIPPVEFEELIYEWDRVLRAGGLLWFEMFYAPVTEMPMYVAIIERMGYKKLYWNYTPKPDAGERGGEHVYLNCVLEKPPRPAREPLAGPSEADMEDIV